MKKALFGYLLLLGMGSYAQQIQVTYERRANIENQLKNIKNEEQKKQVSNILAKPVSYSLIYNDGSSLYISSPETKKTSDSNQTLKIGEKQIKTIQIGKKDGGIYKNHQTREYLQEANLFGKKFLIKDTLKAIEWIFTEETKKIGEYKVKKATAYLNGETVTAWYSEEIPVSEGPHYYYGLPGLIIEAETDKLSFHAISIVFNKKPIPIEKPSKGKEVSLKAFIKLRNEKIEELKSGNGNMLRFGG